MVYTKKHVLRLHGGRHKAECQQYLETFRIRYWWLYYAFVKEHQHQRGKNDPESTRTCMVALGKTFVLVCWLALSHSAVWSTRTHCCTKHVPCCSVQGRFQAILLCIRYADTVAVGAWLVSSLGCVRRRSRVKEKEKKRKEKNRDRSGKNNFLVGN